MKILNFGSLNIDHVYEVPFFIRPGETLASTNYKCYPGGKGLNQSVAIARAGLEVYHAGRVGPNSEILLDVLQESGINTTFLDTTGEVTGHAIIQVNSEGNNCILLYGGSNLSIKKSYIDKVFEEMEGDYILVLQNEINDLEYILNKAIEKKIPVALNPSPIDDTLRKTDLSAVTWLILNEIEGEELGKSNVPDEIINNLLNEYPDMKVVLTLGSEGAIYADKKQRYEQPAIKIDVKDTTGAGDTFTGYFISGVALGKNVAETMKIAASSAAIAVSRDGASSSIPYMIEVDKINKLGE